MVYGQKSSTCDPLLYIILSYLLVAKWKISLILNTRPYYLFWISHVKELSFNLQKGERVCAMDKYELILYVLIWYFKHLIKKKKSIFMWNLFFINWKKQTNKQTKTKQNKTKQNKKKKKKKKQGEDGPFNECEFTLNLGILTFWHFTKTGKNSIMPKFLWELFWLDLLQVTLSVLYDMLGLPAFG